MSASVGIGHFVNQAFAVIAILSFVVLGSFCGLEPGCPETVDQAISGDFPSGACAPLYTITDAELVRWTGSP